MASRLDVLKTYKLFIDGKFPRTESGRSWEVRDGRGRVAAHVCLASRKDLRDAVEAARRSQPGWGSSAPLLRGQILYRVAEMMEGKRDELAKAIATVPPMRRPRFTPRDEVEAAIDRVVHFAGWADKFSQVLGCHNPVAGPFHNFTVAEPVGVVAVVAPDEFSLLAMVTLAAPALCAGNTVVVLCGNANPIPAAVWAEACATGDVPPGVVNVLTGHRSELLRYVAEHRDIDAVHAANLAEPEAELLRLGTAENLKRVRVHRGLDFTDNAQCHSPWLIEPLVEMKTIWHPSSA
jgi:acyl-CoA reductase-like NAD-dependent aldehyde dehydrogenase